MYTCVYVCTCMHWCTRVCMHVCMYHVRVHVCTYVYACMHVYMGCVCAYFGDGDWQTGNQSSRWALKKKRHICTRIHVLHKQVSREPPSICQSTADSRQPDPELAEE